MATVFSCTGSNYPNERPDYWAGWTRFPDFFVYILCEYRHPDGRRKVGGYNERWLALGMLLDGAIAGYLGDIRMLVVETSTPKKLLRDLKGAVSCGKIRVWDRDEEGDFTHTATQWGDKAWLRPIVSVGKLKFKMMRPRLARTTKAVYTFYQAHFAQMLLYHFGDRFSKLTLTPQK